MAEYIIMKKQTFELIFKRLMNIYEYPHVLFQKDTEARIDFENTRRAYLHKRVVADLEDLKKQLVEAN